jgi:hypothetical protein
MWMVVKQYFATQAPVDNIVNIDAIVRVGKNDRGGCYIRFIDGTAMDVGDSFQEITEVLLKAQGK